MTEYSAPWSNNAIGDASLSPYSDLEWATIWRDEIGGTKANSGPLMGSGVSPDPGLTVRATTPASASVEITTGSALVYGKWYQSDTTATKAIAANGAADPRIDTIILRMDFVAQTVRLAVLQGATAPSPVPAALTQVVGTTWEIPLAYITVDAGFVTIVQGKVQDGRAWAGLSDGVYIEDVLNNSGATLETGTVMVWDRTVNRGVKFSAITGDPDTAGVWVGQTPHGGYGRLLVLGIGVVRVSGAVASRGLALVLGTAFGFAVAAATAATASKNHAVGESLEITGGTGPCLAMIDVAKPRQKAITSITAGGAGNTTSATFVDVNASSKVSITPHSDRVKVTAQFSGSIDVAGTVSWDIYSTSLAARAGDATSGLMSIAVIAGSAGEMFPVTLVAIFTGLTPGIAQEFKLQHKSDGAKTVRTYATLVMYAEEL